MKHLWELELSTEIKERKEFVRLIKQKIAESEKWLEENDAWFGLDKELFVRLSKSPDEDVSKLSESILSDLELYYGNDPNAALIAHEKSFLQMLKDKLDNFDVYNQRIKRICEVCKELTRHCICDEIKTL